VVAQEGGAVAQLGRRGGSVGRHGGSVGRRGFQFQQTIFALNFIVQVSNCGVCQLTLTTEWVPVLCSKMVFMADTQK
jgi:hypothetical protein